MLKQGYQNLEMWNRAMSLVKATYVLTQGFPKEELYGLSNQMRRAAVSIPSNIAEGKSRQSTKDFMRFLLIARGSSAELETQMLIAKDLGYTTEAAITPLLKEANEIGRMLSGLLISLNKKLKTSN